MADPIESLSEDTDHALAAATDLRAWDAVRVGILGKQGRLTSLLKELGRLSPDERRERGAALNALRDRLTAAIDERRVVLEAETMAARLAAERVDVTLPPPLDLPGPIHPVSRTTEEVVAIFGAMGFAVAEGPDIETDWHNFSALNMPGHHSARADHDTFYLPAASPASRRACFAPTPRPCRSAPCWPHRRRCGSSCRAASTAPTTMPLTRRCSTNARGWWSTATSRSAILRAA